MKQKPAKYGLKIFMMNDTSTSYMYNGIPYVGKSLKEKEDIELRGCRSCGKEERRKNQ